jgi:aldose sugar dehydrogenase
VVEVRGLHVASLGREMDYKMRPPINQGPVSKERPSMHKHFDESASACRTTRRLHWRPSQPSTIARIAIATLVLFALAPDRAAAQPEVHHPDLQVSTLVEGLVTPISIAFLEADDLFVLEKNTGQLKRVVKGSVQSTVLDLAVNFGSERGLLGIALHPDFPANPSVFLYWTESSTGVDTEVLAETPLLGNRVDRYLWNGSTLTFDLNLIRLRALQPTNEPHETREFGNHDGGVLRFGPDEKLYVLMGDNGRRGQLQNLEDGPFGPGQPDDQFGGPEPDDAHFTGVILRLEEDGTAPDDNPFFDAGADIGGEVGENIQKVYAYGIRNGFGMDFDPESGDLWLQMHGDDTFDELQRILPGTNSGWIQIIGPMSRIDEFKAIETDSATVDPVTGTIYFGLQQARWSPRNIADSPGEARNRLFMLPGAEYRDPEFSWKFAVAPGGMGFVRGQGLGEDFENDLIMGASRLFLEDGYLFRFELSNNRKKLDLDDRRLKDGVADNEHKFDIEESESLLFGSGFGIGTDIQTGPNGNLYVVSLSNGAIYEISRPGEGRGVDRAAMLPQSASKGSGIQSAYPTVQFELPASGSVDIGVYDVTGRLVRSLASGHFNAGAHVLTWDGRSGAGRELPAGIYFAQIKTNQEVQLRKIVRIR